MEKLHHRAQTRGTAPAGGNSLCEFNRLSEGCQTLNDAGTRGRGGGEGGGGVSEDKMWFQVHFAEASVPHIEAIAGQFSVPPQTLGRSDKTSRYIPERPGRPPPPGPELGFLLSPGETATPGTPGFHSSVGGGSG